MADASKAPKVIIKLIKKDNSKKAINIFKTNNWESFKKIVLEVNPDLKDKKFIIKLSADSNYKFDPFFDEDTFNEFHQFIINKHQNNPNDFTSNNCPLCETEIVEEYPQKKIKINYSEIFEKALETQLNNLKDNLKKMLDEETLQKLAKIYEAKNDNNNNENVNITHNNIICNNCYTKNFNGLRFTCAECENFNLCENCEKNNVHFPNHVLIQYNNDVTEKDYYLYQNIIKDNEQILTLNLSEMENDKIKLDVTICNNGLKPFSKCFFSPISFGNNALYGEKIMFNENDDNINPGEKKNLVITLNNIKKKEGNYYSKWRMFTPEGLPFGKVLYLNIRIV